MTVNVQVTVFNRRPGADRRDSYFPTQLSGASYLEARSSGSSAGVRSEAISYKLRIPASVTAEDGRTYVSEAAYKLLSNEEAAAHWTIQKGDVLLTQGLPGLDPMDEPALQKLALESCCDVIRVKEYADNTLRGSDAVRHWRIGGE